MLTLYYMKNENVPTTKINNGVDLYFYQISICMCIVKYSIIPLTLTCNK